MISRLVDSMHPAGVPHWLSGGWAIDFHAGRPTRPHSDIVFVVDVAARDELRRILETFGVIPIRRDDQGAVESFRLDGEEVEITYVVHDDGVWFTPGYEAWPYIEGTFDGPSLTLNGVTVVSAESLLDAKAGWLDNVGDEPRPHDLSDIALLRGLLGV